MRKNWLIITIGLVVAVLAVAAVACGDDDDDGDDDGGGEDGATTLSATLSEVEGNGATGNATTSWCSPSTRRSRRWRD